jgi:phosphoenolpyruvate-protein phosphotransferase
MLEKQGSERQDRLRVSSPLKGWCATLDDSPDPVFRDRILGEGVSIDPTVGEIHAPFDGEVLTVPDSRHAINLRASNGAEFLIHVGIDSVRMAGEGFETHVAPGDRIKEGQLLLSFDLDKVLRGASSLKTPVLLLESGNFETRKLRSEGPVVIGDELFEVVPVIPSHDAVSQVEDGDELTKTVAVGLEHGIHARPAAALIAGIKNLEASVFCQFGDRGRADARSAVALMSLGVSYGDIVTVAARGKDAVVAIDKFVLFLEPLAHDSGRQGTPAESYSRTEQPKVTVDPPADGSVIKAQAASPGLGLGKAFRLNAGNVFIRVDSRSVTEERQELENAVAKVCLHLQQLAGSEQGTGAEIAVAHLALLEDPLITSAAEELITAGRSAPQAWQESVNAAVATLRQLDDMRMRERVDDLFDINLRVQQVLAGQDPGKGPELPPGSIILAENLLPSQLLKLDRDRVRGICLAAGGATSHVAILALSQNIPMLVAAGAEVLLIEDGSSLLIDAEFGELQVRPEEVTLSAFRERIEKDRVRQQADQAAALDECRTSDGVRIHINANLASAPEAESAVRAGAEGCGLLRTEFAFMDRSQAPGTEEQLKTYQQVSEALGPRPMVVRTLDAGGDKPISYIDQDAEENPALGVRGIRLSLRNEDLLKTQLEALLQLDRPVPLHVMIPMVSSLHEVHAVRSMLDTLTTDDSNRTEIRLGVMIETPAAALIANRLASIVDFFSIGTNDLTQYTLCMDRGEPKLAEHLDSLHPAVLMLIKSTADAALAADIPVAVCGGAAGDVLAAPILIGMGIRELSMPKSLIARQKAQLRRLLVEECTELANAALDMDSASEVRSMMREFLTNH